MKLFFILVLIILTTSISAHRGEFLSIEQVRIVTAEDGFITYSFKIKNITNKTLKGIQIEFIRNGVSLRQHYFNIITNNKKFTNDYFTFNQKEINPQKDQVQIEITKIFDKINDWGGWDSPNTLKQTNTLNSEFYVEAPWRMKKTDSLANDLSIPLHFFLHDADKVTGFTLKIDYINIRIKSASNPSFGNKLTYNTIPASTLHSMFSCISPNDPGLSIKQFDTTSFTATFTYTFDFDAESDLIDDYVSVDDTYWYFTFNIPATELIGLDNIIDIEATIGYANIAIPATDVLRMRVFRSDTKIPTQTNYYRGDTHLHSMYTQNSAEIGLPLCSTKEAAKLIGLDWITTTDHTSDFDNYGNGNINTNWTLLQNEVSSLNATDNSLIYIAGQEVAVNNSDNKLVHMLAYPSYNTPTNFPFLGDGNGDLIPTAVSIDNVIAQLTAVDGFSYCAHPFATEDKLPATPVNGGVWNLGAIGFPTNGSSFPETEGNIICNNTTINSDVLDPSSSKFIKDAIKGSQIWNIRPNVEVSGNLFNNLDPWDVTNSNTPMSQVDTSQFIFHHKRLRQGHEVVNYINQLGLAGKNTNSSIKNWKMYYSAGADAHGSFNSNNTDNFGGTGVVNNNAVGKVNTVAYCPNGMGTNGSEILKAMYNGNISMSDGPLITMGISIDGNNNNNEIIMGEDSVLNTSNISNVYINFNYTTTLEFGDFVRFTFIVGTSTGEVRKNLTLSNTTGNINESYHLMSLLDSIFGVGNTPINQYLYVRSEIETFVDYSGMTNEYRTSYDIFHSYTNPIWIKWRLNISVSEITTNEFSIFPNPTTNQIIIEMDDAIVFSNYQLYNNLGQLVAQKKIESKREIIDMSKFTEGLYNLVVFQKNGKSISKKIIKK